MGGTHGNLTNFNSVPDAGCHYLTGGMNGPGTASQYYGFTLGLGINHTLSNYGTQIYWGRNVTNPYINVRYLLSLIHI